METSEIKDRKSLEAWLEDKPPQWARAIAARIALRVAPVGLSVAALPEERLAREHRHTLCLLTFRASFISAV